MYHKLVDYDRAQFPKSSETPSDRYMSSPPVSPRYYWKSGRVAICYMSSFSRWSKVNHTHVHHISVGLSISEVIRVDRMWVVLTLSQYSKQALTLGCLVPVRDSIKLSWNMSIKCAPSRISVTMLQHDHVYELIWSNARIRGSSNVRDWQNDHSDESCIAHPQSQVHRTAFNEKTTSGAKFIRRNAIEWLCKIVQLVGNLALSDICPIILRWSFCQVCRKSEWGAERRWTISSQRFGWIWAENPGHMPHADCWCQSVVQQSTKGIAAGCSWAPLAYANRNISVFVFGIENVLLWPRDLSRGSQIMMKIRIESRIRPWLTLYSAHSTTE